eukprot:Skav233762  [mRNA]  locus=scaffold2701:139140:140695:+ [translate_table: standard]
MFTSLGAGQLHRGAHLVGSFGGAAEPRRAASAAGGAGAPSAPAVPGGGDGGAAPGAVAFLALREATGGRGEAERSCSAPPWWLVVVSVGVSSGY